MEVFLLRRFASTMLDFEVGISLYGGPSANVGTVVYVTTGPRLHDMEGQQAASVRSRMTVTRDLMALRRACNFIPDRPEYIQHFKD